MGLTRDPPGVTVLADANRCPLAGLPPRSTAYGLFPRWQRDGVWAAELTGLQTRADAAGLIAWEVNVDSAICVADLGRRWRSYPFSDGSERLGCPGLRTYPIRSAHYLARKGWSRRYEACGGR